MKTYAVAFAPEAEDDLAELYHYIAAHGSPVTALQYTEAIITYCESMSSLPHRGTRRDDVRPGLRITNYRHRTVIAFEVDDPAGIVTVLGVYYGGRDYESVFGGGENSAPDRK